MQRWFLLDFDCIRRSVGAACCSNSLATADILRASRNIWASFAHRRMPVKKVNLFRWRKTLYRMNTLSGKLHDFGSALPWSQYPISLVSHLPSPVSFHMQMTPGRTDAYLMARLGNLDLSFSVVVQRKGTFLCPKWDIGRAAR